MGCNRVEEHAVTPATGKRNVLSYLQVLSFVLDAVRAEAFNEKRTLFLFGSYTIGKEKLFLEVARVLQQKVHNLFAAQTYWRCCTICALISSCDSHV